MSSTKSINEFLVGVKTKAEEMQVLAETKIGDITIRLKDRYARSSVGPFSVLEVDMQEPDADGDLQDRTYRIGPGAVKLFEMASNRNDDVDDDVATMINTFIAQCASEQADYAQRLAEKASKAWAPTQELDSASIEKSGCVIQEIENL